MLYIMPSIVLLSVILLNAEAPSEEGCKKF